MRAAGGPGRDRRLSRPDPREVPGATAVTGTEATGAPSRPCRGVRPVERGRAAAARLRPVPLLALAPSRAPVRAAGALVSQAATPASEVLVCRCYKRGHL